MRKVQTPLTAENGMAVEFSVLAGDEVIGGITATAEFFYSLQEEGESVQLYQISDENPTAGRNVHAGLRKSGV